MSLTPANVRGKRRERGGQWLLRFWGKAIVGRPDQCWLWVGGLMGDGYGQFSRKGTMELAHRIAYEIAKGDVPDDLCVCHSCDNRRCVNPEHLWLGTNYDNVQDRVRKGRSGKVRGERHPYCKLSEVDIRYMRAFAAGGMPQWRIGELLGCSQSYASEILRGEARVGEGQ